MKKKVQKRDLQGESVVPTYTLHVITRCRILFQCYILNVTLNKMVEIYIVESACLPAQNKPAAGVTGTTVTANSEIVNVSSLLN